MNNYLKNQLIHDSYSLNIDIYALISEIFSIVREALVDISNGNLCTAILQLYSNQILISTRQPISSKHLQNIKQQITDYISQVQFNLEPHQNFQAIINNQAEIKYNFDETKSQFDQHIIIPLAIQNNIVGILYVGSFDKAIDLRKARLIQHLSNETPRALRHLWYLHTRQKEKFETLVSRITDGVILCDWRKRILFINHAAKRYLGINIKRKLIGTSLNNLPAEFLVEYLEKALKAGIFESNKVVSTADQQSKFIGVHIELLKNCRRKEIGWMIILRDVTKNWQCDQMRSSLSAASHEIKSPLTSMEGAIDLLLEKDLGQLNQQQEHCLNVIKDDIFRLRRLLKDLLDLSRFDEGIQFLDRRKEIRLRVLVNDVVESFQFYANSKNIQIENRVPKTLPTFKGDRDRLRQVLANLVENSIKYSLPGGHVTIDADLIKTTLKVWVKDTGVGIPSKEFKRIFERFQQLDNFPERGQRGYGLGLSIAKQIVESYGGEIWVESEVGVGSTFFFTIPV